MFEGLRSPSDSREYKIAKIEAQRLVAPVMAILIPAFSVFLLVVFATGKTDEAKYVDVKVLDVEETKELEKEDQPQPDEMPEIVTDIQFDSNLDLPNEPISDAPMTSQPQAYDAVLNVKSPVVLRGVYGATRNAGMRGQLLARGGGNAATEAAVLRALRWLKKHQESNGSWTLRSGGGDGSLKNTSVNNGVPIGTTGLGLLTFLAHGEVPGSPEFGATVQGAIEYLMNSLNSSGVFAFKDAQKDYSHLVATYALCEAYAMTSNPNVKEAAERAMNELIRRQKPEGGWDYIGENAPGRIDVSMTAWAAQAMKAGQIAGLTCPELESTLRRTVNSFKLFYRKRDSYGYYSYRSTENRWYGLTGAAVLSQQLLGAAQKPEVRQGINWLRQNTSFDWEKPTENLNDNPIYNWYYITQVMFHEGGAVWQEWNKQFSMQLVKQQTIIPKAIEDANGQLQDIGYWKPCTPKEWSQSFCYNTTFCALQLMVYYRYLPTFKALSLPEELIVKPATDDGDIKVNVDI